MLNIDYSTKERFMMSFGITIVFLVLLFILTGLVLFIEKGDKLLENENPTDAEIDMYNRVKNLFFLYVGIALVIGIMGVVVSIKGYNASAKKKWK